MAVYNENRLKRTIGQNITFLKIERVDSLCALLDYLHGFDGISDLILGP